MKNLHTPISMVSSPRSFVSSTWAHLPPDFKLPVSRVESSICAMFYARRLWPGDSPELALVFLHLKSEVSNLSLERCLTVWVYPPEILPLRIRGKGTALATACNWIINVRHTDQENRLSLDIDLIPGQTFNSVSSPSWRSFPPQSKICEFCCIETKS